MRVAVVGPCASGKSTLVTALEACGLDAYAVAQEHSDIGELWARRQPERLIYLDVSLNTLRERRRNPFWPCWVYDLQLGRLTDARSRADLVIDTNNMDPAAVAELAVKWLIT